MISPEQVRELLTYDLSTGLFTRRLYASSNAQIGDRAGSPNGQGYDRTTLLGTAYLNSRLAWAHVHGHWPEGVIDHKDGDTSNNRIKNLRDGGQQQNCENRHTANSNNPSMYLGVSWNSQKQKWKATISVRRKYYHLGFFALPLEAHQAYLQAKRELHEGCTI